MLKLVPINEIKDYWPEIKKGLDNLLLKAPDLWIPEDVYTELMLNKASLYIAEDTELLGFTILNTTMQYNMLMLNVWIAVSFSEPENTLFAINEVKKIAESINAKYITFSSSRKGIEKLAIKNGFIPTQQNFIYDV
jgi:hypothetical protein